MQTRQGWVLEALRRTQDFLDANPELLATVNESSARRNLDEIVEQLTAHAASQDGSARGGMGETARQRTLCAALRSRHMRVIALVAKRKLRGVPEFESLKMPRGNLTVEGLVAAARGMAQTAQEHAEILISNGLRADFIEQLLAAAMVLEKSVDERNAFWGRRTGSTAGLKAEQARGRTILQVLDCVVRPMLGDDQGLVAQWMLAKHVKRARSVVAPPTTPTLVAAGTTSTPSLPAGLSVSPSTAAEAA